MSVKGIQDLRARFLADNKIDHKEVSSLIKEAEDGFLFIKHVSTSEKQELTQLLEQHADKFEPGAKEKLAAFLGIQLVTPAGLQQSLGKLKSSLEAAQDGAGQVDLQKVARGVDGDRAAEAALGVVEKEFSTARPVTVPTSCGGSSTSMVEEKPTTINGAKASTVFNALVEAKREISNLDRDGNQVLSAEERAAAGQLDGLSGHVVKAAVDEAAKPKRVGTSC